MPPAPRSRKDCAWCPPISRPRSVTGPASPRTICGATRASPIRSRPSFRRKASSRRAPRRSRSACSPRRAVASTCPGCAARPRPWSWRRWRARSVAPSSRSRRISTRPAASPTISASCSARRPTNRRRPAKATCSSSPPASPRLTRTSTRTAAGPWRGWPRWPIWPRNGRFACSWSRRWRSSARWCRAPSSGRTSPASRPRRSSIATRS